MTKTIETIGAYSIVKSGEYSFDVLLDGVRIDGFRTLARCRDLIAMLNGEDL